MTISNRIELIKAKIDKVHADSEDLVTFLKVLEMELKELDNISLEKIKNLEEADKIIKNAELKKKQVAEYEQTLATIHEKEEKLQEERDLLEKERIILREKQISLEILEKKLQEKANKLSRIMSD